MIIRDPQRIRWIAKPTKEEQREALERDFELTLPLINNLDQDIVADVFKQMATGNRANEILFGMQPKQPLTPKLQMALVHYYELLLRDIKFFH